MLYFLLLHYVEQDEELNLNYINADTPTVTCLLQCIISFLWPVQQGSINNTVDDSTNTYFICDLRDVHLLRYAAQCGMFTEVYSCVYHCVIPLITVDTCANHCKLCLYPCRRRRSLAWIMRSLCLCVCVCMSAR